LTNQSALFKIRYPSPVNVTKILTIYPSPAHCPLYPLMKYSVITIAPNSFLSNLNHGILLSIEYTSPPVHITYTDIAIANHTH